METILIDKLAMKIEAYKNCKAAGKPHADIWEEEIETELKKLPSGSGINNGVKLLWDKCQREKVVFSLGFHHMDDSGYYDGWTEHELTVTPSFLGGYVMKISGRDRNQIKDYLYEVFGSLFSISK